MKKQILTLLSICILANAYGQKFELAVNANSGLYHYSGKSSTSTSFVNGAGSTDAYINNPYGNQNGFSYGGALQGQYISKGGFIIGLQAGYEILRAKVGIDANYVLFTPSPNSPPSPAQTSSGSTFLQSTYVNLNPYIGYRLHIKKVSVDLLPGIMIQARVCINC